MIKTLMLEETMRSPAKVLVLASSSSIYFSLRIPCLGILLSPSDL